MLAGLLNFLFPEQCPQCGGRPSVYNISPFCPECWDSISRYEGPACSVCGRPFSSDDASICAGCISHSPPFHSARSYGLYNGVLRKAVGQLKYHRRRALARPLGDLLAGIGIPDADAIVPVPLFKKRLCTREYNQSALLAAHLSKSTGIPVLLNRLFKVRETPPQVGLSAAQRRKNLKGAFSVRQRGGIMGRRILLVDDVITTGATAAECATALLEAGATEVYIVALAHGIQA